MICAHMERLAQKFKGKSPHRTGAEIAESCSCSALLCYHLKTKGNLKTPFQVFADTISSGILFLQIFGSFSRF